MVCIEFALAFLFLHVDRRCQTPPNLNLYIKRGVRSKGSVSPRLGKNYFGHDRLAVRRSLYRSTTPYCRP